MKKLCMTVAMFTAFALPSMADLIQNGSFETGTCGPGGFTTIASVNSTCIANWTVSNGSIDYIGTHWTAGDGNRSIDLSGGGNGTISQTFNTVAGQSYRVNFLIAGNPDGAPTVKGLDASAGNYSGAFTFDITGKTRSDMGWVSKSFVFQATGATTTLSFSSSTGTAYGSALDGVSVNQVPEPAALGLLVLAGYAATRKRRTK